MEIALILINRIARARSLAREDWIKKWKKKERKTIFQLLCAICFAIAIAHSSFFVWLLSSTLGSVHSFYRNQHRWNAADGACRWNYSTLRRVKCTQSDHASSTVDCAKRFFSCVLPISRNVNSIHSQPRPQMPPPPYCFCSTKALDTFNCFFTTNKNIECFFVVVQARHHSYRRPWRARWCDKPLVCEISSTDRTRPNVCIIFAWIVD